MDNSLPVSPYCKYQETFTDCYSAAILNHQYAENERKNNDF